MDVAILGTGAVARRFARGFLFGTDAAEPAARSTDRDAETAFTEVNGRVDNSERDFAITLYGADATAVMDAVDALEDELHEYADSAGADHFKRVDGTTDLETAVSGANLALETRSGDLETVRRRLAGVEERLGDEAILAVQSDVAPATAAAAALERPGRAIGLSMVAPEAGESTGEPFSFDSGGVFEVVRADQTEDTTIDAVTDFFVRLGWNPVVVNDAPGRLAERLQLALEVEAMRAVEADVAGPAAIDAVLEGGFGHVDGPLANADRAGLDARLERLESLAAELGSRFEPPPVLRRKVEAGQLGVKTGSGFREWDDGQSVDSDDSTGT